MKKTSVLLALTACVLSAEQTIEGPRLGHVNTAAGLRSVMGIAGASRLGEPLARDLRNAIALPATDAAFGIDGAGELTRVSLREGTSLNLGLKDVTRLVASPSGEKVLAVQAAKVFWYSSDGVRIADVDLPGTPISIAVADAGNVAAITIADADGEALFVSGDQGWKRLLHASRFTALAFLPASRQFVFADADGHISRVGSDLELAQIVTLPGARALAGLRDGSRLLAVTDRAVSVVRADTGQTESVDCVCARPAAQWLAGDVFLVNDSGDGPMRVLDTATAELRLAFIPEPVDE